jgi:hypothetical protein
MQSSRIYSRSALVVGVLLCLLVPSSAVAAGAPAAVTVRVEGLTETKLPPTLVTTTATNVVKDGNTADFCTGTSAIGALQLATAGSWSGPWEAKFNQYSIYTIAGETHEFEESSPDNYYWSFWLDNKEATIGACEAELQTGDQVLFFPACYGPSCPTPAPTPLAIEAPPTANVGENVAVTVKQYSSEGNVTPAAGANVTGGGTSATTDSQGHATLRFSASATDTLRVSGAAEGPPAIRTEAAICVHEGNDGTCGTNVATATNQGTGVGKKALPLLPYKGPYAIVARGTGLRDGHVYSHRHAPRVLTGTLTSHAGVTSISIRLRRLWNGRCWAYSGKLERFVKERCGRGSFFSIATARSSFSYLLPSKLPPGRYVYDIRATDSVGNHTALDRGTSRIVFYVK